MKLLRHASLGDKLTLYIFTVFSFLHFNTGLVFAQPRDWVEFQGLNCTGAAAGGNLGIIAEDVATVQGFACLIANIFSVTVTFIGLAAFLMFIISAFRLLLSGGNQKALETARGTITYAIVGIVVALSSFIILNLITAFTGVNVSDFVIPQATTEVSAP